jgi:hypothetical protein
MHEGSVLCVQGTLSHSTKGNGLGVSFVYSDSPIKIDYDVTTKVGR